MYVLSCVHMLKIPIYWVFFDEFLYTIFDGSYFKKGHKLVLDNENLVKKFPYFI